MLRGPRGSQEEPGTIPRPKEDRDFGVRQSRVPVLVAASHQLWDFALNLAELSVHVCKSGLITVSA